MELSLRGVKRRWYSAGLSELVAGITALFWIYDVLFRHVFEIRHMHGRFAREQSTYKEGQVHEMCVRTANRW